LVDTPAARVPWYAMKGPEAAIAMAAIPSSAAFSV